MAEPLYIPTPLTQGRIAGALNVLKVQDVSINPGLPDDNTVEVLFEHTPDYLPEGCTDKYTLQKEVDESLLVKKEFCPGALTKESKQDRVSPVRESKRWFALQSLFIPDTKIVKVPPDSWAQAQGVRSWIEDLSMWTFANPRFDPLRKLWERPQDSFTKEIGMDVAKRLEHINLPPDQNLPAWQAFASFLSPLEERLQEFIDQWQKQPAIQSAGTTFGKLFSNLDEVPPLERLKELIGKTFIEEDLKPIVQKVGSIIFSTYPFMSEESLEEATQVVTAWVLRRLLYQAGAEAQLQGAALPALSPVTTSYSIGTESQKLFETTLYSALLDPNTTLRDIEKIQLGYQGVMWPNKSEILSNTVLMLPRTTMDYLKGKEIESEFDKQISTPVFERLFAQMGSMSKETQVVLSNRLSTLLRLLPTAKLNKESLALVVLPYDWGQFNFATNRSASALLEFKPTENTLEKRAQELVETTVGGNPLGKFTSYQLDTPSSYEIIIRLKKLVGSGLNSIFAKNIIQTLLQLDEKGSLGLEPEAKNALILALNDSTLDFTAPNQAFVSPPDQGEATAKRNEDEEHFYQKWWFWAIAGSVAAAAIGGGVYAMFGGNDNNDGNHPPPPPPDDNSGRGKSNTVGP